MTHDGEGYGHVAWGAPGGSGGYCLSHTGDGIDSDWHGDGDGLSVHEPPEVAQ